MARQNLQGYDARFVKGEVDKLDLPAESFDRIICTEVLEHTERPEQCPGVQRPGRAGIGVGQPLQSRCTAASDPGPRS